MWIAFRVLCNESHSLDNAVILFKKDKFYNNID